MYGVAENGECCGIVLKCDLFDLMMDMIDFGDFNIRLTGEQKFTRIVLNCDFFD